MALYLPMPRLLLFLLVFCPAGLMAQTAKNVSLLCNWMDTSNAPKVNGQHFNDVWGLTNAGKEYAVIGSSNGTHLIDVTNCREVVFYPGRSQNVTHRDYKTYKNYLYAVADEGAATLQIFDYSYLPDSLHLVYESNPVAISRSHTIFIDTATAKLYFGIFRNASGVHDAMRVYSIQKPDSPVLITTYNEFGDVHAVYVRNDTAYCSSSNAGYIINRFNSPTAPYETIGGLTFYPYRGYNHSSWVNNAGIGVMADETFGSPLKVIDTRIIYDPKVLSTFSPRGTDSTCVPHNPYLIGNYAFISYYQDGFQLYDLSDPANPRQAGYYDTHPGVPIQQFAGAWGCYPFLPSRKVLISDMQTGLYVLDASAALSLQDVQRTATAIQLYPNPASTVVRVKLPSGVRGSAVCTAYDVAGKAVQTWNPQIPVEANDPITLPLSGLLKAGTYVLRTEAGGRIFTGRFTKL